MARNLTSIPRITAILLFAAAVTGCTGGGEQSEKAAQLPSNPIEVMESARIFPDPAHSDNILELKFQASPHAKLSDFVVVWKRNGNPIEGASGATLASTYFSKGDEMSVEIRFQDPSAADKRYETPVVRVVNSTPRIVSASTSMAMREKSEIFLHVNCVDVDDDGIVLTYQWYANGRALEGQTGESLDPALVQRGDEVSAEIVASDGVGESAPFKSSALKIANHAPRITSVPSAPKPEDDVFNYQIVVEDADSDRLTYELLNAPEGMTVDSYGMVTWVLPPSAERSGIHEIEIRVSDPQGGGAVQKFKVNFTQAASTPQ